MIDSQENRGVVHPEGNTPFSPATAGARTALNRLLAVAAEEGLDTIQFSRRQRIDATVLSAKGEYINRHHYFDITRKVIDLLTLPDISFRVGRKFNFGDLGILGHAMLSSANISQAILTYIRYRDAFGSVFNISCVNNENGLVISPKMLPMDDTVRCYLLENWLLTWSRLSELINCGDRLFKELHVSFRQPEYADSYHDLFKCPIYFGSQRTEVHISPEVANQSLKYSNSGVYELCKSECEFARRELNLPRNIELMIKEQLYASYQHFPAAETMAREMNMSSRTFRRRLAESGTTYNRILHEVRMSRASKYQAEGRLSIKEVAFILGYQDSSSYHRAFKNRFGVTPLQFKTRTAHRS